MHRSLQQGPPRPALGPGAAGIRHDRRHKREPATRPAPAARAGCHRRYPLQQHAAAVMFAPCLLGCRGTSRQHPASSVTATCTITVDTAENGIESTDLIAEQRTPNPRELTRRSTAPLPPFPLYSPSQCPPLVPAGPRQAGQAEGGSAKGAVRHTAPTAPAPSAIRP